MDQALPEDTLFASGPMFFEAIVNKQPRVDPLGSGTKLHAGFPVLGTSGNKAEKRKS